MKILQSENPQGYNCSLISMVVSSGSILEPSTSQVCHVKMQSLIIDHLISKRWGKIYSENIKYDLPQDEVYESNPITFRKYLANMTEKWASTPDINNSMKYPVIIIPPPYTLRIFIIIRWNQPRFYMYYPEFPLKSYSSTPTS